MSRLSVEILRKIHMIFMPPTLKKWGDILVSICPWLCMGGGGGGRDRGREGSGGQDGCERRIEVFV